MKYIYYPGCSLEGSAREYDFSTRAVLKALGAELVSLEDWTCCGASAAGPVSRLLSLVLPARNLALAEKTGLGRDILAPCSACYLNLRKVEDSAAQDPDLKARINEALSVEGLTYHGGVAVRHLLDILSRDFPIRRVAERVTVDLAGLKVAPYYGCQALRPYGDFDDPEDPRSMEPVLVALGVRVHHWNMGGRCCGAGLMTTKKHLALELTASILAAAQGADCIVTVCPMCQMNLETYQEEASRHRDVRISVLYLSQLMGLAFGLPEDDLKLNLNLALTDVFRRKTRLISGPEHELPLSSS